MPINTRVYTTSASIKFPEGQEPKYSWNLELSVKLNTVALPDGECAKIMAEVYALFAKYPDKLTNLTMNMREESFETRVEYDYKEIDKLRAIIESWELDPDAEELQKHKDWLEKLYERNPERRPNEFGVDETMEAAVADLAPTYPDDLKCEDEEA